MAEAPSESRVWAALCLAGDAKPVKDALKGRGWLDHSWKVGSTTLFKGRIAFPLLAETVADVRLAREEGNLAALAAVQSVEQVSGLEKAKQAPPQGKNAAASQAKKRPQKQQPRSFGGGVGELASLEVKDTVLVGLNLGPCVGGWTPRRLSAAHCTCDPVSVHVCSPPDQRKPSLQRNFVFKTLTFAEAVNRCADDENAPMFEPLIEKGERYYLRSVGADPRHQASDFHVLFPDLATECTLLPLQDSDSEQAAAGTKVPLLRPPEPDPEPEAQREPLVDPSQYHSSVLRLASSDTQLWTHFDVMDNLLAQVTGRKRVVLWPPEQDENLYVDGSSSRVECVDRWNDEEYPLFRRAVQHRTECELAPGEVLYIPALWFHNVTSIGFSVAVNVFWRGGASYTEERSGARSSGRNSEWKKTQHALSHLYDQNDLYGNRDPPAASTALDHTAVAVAQLERLPQPFRSFYARRAAREILALASDDRSDLERVAISTGSTDTSGGAHTSKTVLLNSGHRMPLLGFGTRQIPRSLTETAVKTAIEAGIRHIDTASTYRNELEVGAALHNVLTINGLRRDELWVTGKLWNSDHGPDVEQVRTACVRSLVALGLDYFDLYLMHWPIASGQSSGTPIAATWRAMEQLVKDGLVKSIGVANFGAVRLQALCAASAIAPAVNQVEVHPGWRNEALVKTCARIGVHVTASAPLGSGTDAGLLEDPAVKLLAQVHQITPAQLLLHWGMSRGYSVIPRSSSALHIEEIARCRIADAAKHAIEASEWSTLDCITQHRQIDGTDLLLADSAQTGPDAICSLAELWEEEKEEKEAAAAEEAAA